MDIPYPNVISHSRAVNRPGEYAVLPRENRFPSFLPFWENTTIEVLNSGARFSKFYVAEIVLHRGGQTTKPISDGLEHFLFVLKGKIEFTTNEKGRTATCILKNNDYVWLPPTDSYSIRNCSNEDSRIYWLRKEYLQVEGIDIPKKYFGNENEIPFLEIDTHIERDLFPYSENMGFDIAMKTIYFEPGAYFTFVESHVQEHGLVFLKGNGIYYLNEHFHEVHEGDFIYMAPWCLQSMYATGSGLSGYLLYKDFNRDVPF